MIPFLTLRPRVFDRGADWDYRAEDIFFQGGTYFSREGHIFPGRNIFLQGGTYFSRE
jgi:hypothetical protein